MHLIREAQIRKIIEEIAHKQVEIGPDASLFESGVVDSFALVDLVASLEQEFGLKIPDSDLIPQKFETIAKIDAYLAAQARP